MLFGWKRVPPWLHVTSAVLVALGTALSGFWILSANSWMQTPAGYVMRDGIAYPVDWLRIIFNPGFPYRFAHMMSAAYLTTSIVVMAVGARYLLKARFEVEAKTMLRMGVGMVAVMGPLQLLLGDAHGLNTLHYQPAKIAAIEAHWEGEGPAALVLFGWPDEAHETNRFEVKIPRLGSLILTHDPNGRVPALKDFAPRDRPPVLPGFLGFRLMVAIGLTLIALGLTGAWLWFRGRLFTSRWFLRIAALAWPLGFTAILAGWITTETGRQPFVVYGILRTADAASPVAGGAVVASLAAFIVVYCIVFTIALYFIRKLMRHGPQGAAIETTSPGSPGANRPLSSAQQPIRESKS